MSVLVYAPVCLGAWFYVRDSREMLRYEVAVMIVGESVNSR